MDTSRVFDKCRVSNCVLTKQRQYMDNADIVLFRASDLKNCLKKTKREQIWMIFEHEAPTSFEILSKLDQHCYRNAFNWTLTYRRDSDFTFVHGLFSKRTSIFNESVVDKIIKSKTKTAVAFISHCHSQSRRLEYIQRLRQNGIDVDIYGECGTLKCKYGLGYAGDFKMIWKVASDLKMKKDCFDVLDSRYKFYISFENSLCDDYNTEKSHHLVLQHNIIPIIRDASNHSLFHPPKSYLDTKDFKTVKSLADRIKQINYSSDEYKKYLQWKKYFYSETVRGVLQSNMCDICERLHNQDKYRRIHGNIVDFLFTRGDKSPICHKPLDL
ncbi:alpha-(1,3)-fucosyltransferase C-like [Ylistrum balloti]|uniref:alpha-(1,3)-fucosyltransferase C-like n=1 Tax=Ylistrum balloti TaxID=509963 RepID=UPI002905EA33|nr:alpha-(1,3)-fucosyltransferase C-like [Ylistrum balloti]